MGNWYTADPHFNHSAIIKFCDRPFSDVSQMDQTILRNLKARVGWHDDLYIIGDFSFGGESSRSYVQRCFDRVPGRKHLIVPKIFLLCRSNPLCSTNPPYRALKKRNFESRRNKVKIHL